MIILEGPDGSGKTNLSRHLHERLGLEINPRMVTSEGGPNEATLYRQMHDDLLTWDKSVEPRIYDRHPLISEFIYGPIVRGRMSVGFGHPSMMHLRKRVAYQSLVILALPPLWIVRKNVLNEDVPQMPGVVDQITAIYHRYEMLQHEWPGWVVRYYYDAEDGATQSREAVTRAARLHIAEWKRHHR